MGRNGLILAAPAGMSKTIAALCLAIAACGPTAGFGIDAGPGGGHADGGGGAAKPDADHHTTEFVDAAVCDQTVPVSVQIVGDPPDMLLVVDKSGSMSAPLDIFMPFTSKWSVMDTALNDVLAAKQDQINFGLELFPSDDTCGAGMMGLGVAPHNASPITAALGVVVPGGATPTHTSMDAALAYFDSIPVNPNGRYVLLATDGQPNCAGGDPNTASIAESIAAIGALHAAGINTFVIGFGSVLTADPTTLMSMATAGGTAMYYSASSPAELTAALNAISGMVIVPSCTYMLSGPPADPSLLAVSIDGVPIPRDPSHTTGWDYDPGTNTITFYGDTCTQVQSGSVMSLHVDYGCGGPVIT